ncbi:MAG TPA: glycosyl hydrolase family 79 C-terminal domain-containing protein [Acidobacteriaceae bacterium]|nr:glycosyl hydrolase family 79 C-terminal domain-containing protein [Acidobacteriaceae bacterium]
MSRTAASAALAGMPKLLLAQSASTTSARLTIQPDKDGYPIPKDFLGLSYESAQLAHPDYFSAQNKSFAGFLRALGTGGVLRIGGNTSEYAMWTPNPAPSANTEIPQAVNPDPGHKPAPLTQTTPQAIRNLRDFVEMADWRVIYGLNLGKGTPEQAADEAAFVSKTLGSRLICLQIGNESDLFHHNGLRPPTYDYAAFAKDWQRFHDAVKAKIPQAKFAGPDTAGTAVWIEEFARQFQAEIMLLSTHYYAEGPASDPSMNISRLLHPNPRWEAGIAKIRLAMGQSQLPFRLTEVNSCYGGGKPGVSNPFASALWALDLMFQLISFGASGVNFHTGGYGWYATVVGTMQNGFVARPEYYALLLFSQLVGGRMVQSQLDTAASDPLLVAYAVKNAQGTLQTVVINKHAQKDARLHLQASQAGQTVAVQRLIAPALEDETDVTLAAAPVGADGAWQPSHTERIAVRNGSAEFMVPAASAALLSWD